MPEATKNKRIPPKGKKKGGAMFPRINLEDSVNYAKKMVSKTHIGPQPASTLFAGVFGATGSRGEIKASALKQYGLMEGNRTAHTASKLAKQIAAAPAEDLPRLHQQACLNPKVFRTLFDTFHGDTIPLGRLRQQAHQFGVHPEELDNCVQLFIESVTFAQLGTQKGDSLELQLVTDIPADNEENNENGEETEERVRSTATKDVGSEILKESDQSHASARSVIHVNVTIDSSLDTEKLERQLALLRKFGAI